VPLLGTETEYGILAPGRPDLDADALSALVVDACTAPATAAVEGTHNRTLGNGGRLYVDHGHPEYATPETATPTEALTWELAGDALVAAAARAASERAGTPVRVFKNNTDGKGASYGYHENLLLRRSTDFGLVVAALPAVLVSRVVLGGAGRVGLGPHGDAAGFQLSQRADFFERVVGLDTTRRRGIVNTRDEPHARPSAWRRLHVITGDATRSPFATWLKLGTLALALAALEVGLLPVVTLADPVGAFRRVSRDTTARAPLALDGGVTTTAVGLQERFRDAGARLVEREGFPEGEGLVAAWTDTLDALRRDPVELADRLDWAAKLALLEGYRARDRLGWDHPKLAQVDLAWADLSAGGVVERLRAAGRLAPGPDRCAVEAAVSAPPPSTRAYTRGRWVVDHPDAVVAATWESLLVRDGRGFLHTLRMPDPYHPAAADHEAGAPPDRLIATHEASPHGEGRHRERQGGR